MKPGYFSEDIEEFLHLLHKHTVQYMIVGGEAVIYYGYPRLTGDVDIFYGLSPENITHLYEALLEFWNGDIPGIDDEKELQTPGYIIQFGISPNRIDLMNKIDGVDFTEAWKEKKIESILINDNVVSVYIIGLKHLILNKTESARNKDLDDLSYLTEIK